MTTHYAWSTECPCGYLHTNTEARELNGSPGTPFDRLLDLTDYVIFAKANGFYTVAGPGGTVVASAVTLRGARKAIRKDRKRDHTKFWERPVVYREPASPPTSEEILTDHEGMNEPPGM